MPDTDDADWRAELAEAARAAGGAPPSSNEPDRWLRYGTERNLKGEPRYRGAVIFDDGTVALVPVNEAVFGNGPRGHHGAIHGRDPSLLEDLVSSYRAGRVITVEAFRVQMDGVPTMRATGWFDVVPEHCRAVVREMAKAHGARRIEMNEVEGYGSTPKPPRFIDV